MSDTVDVTVNVAVSHCVWFGAGAHTWYTTVHGFGVASYVTTLPVNDGFAQVPPVSVNVLPGGTWSLPPRSNVFPVEPLPQEDPLWQHPQVVITPHMASIAQTEVIARQLLDNIQRLQQALPLKNLVNKQSGY